MKYLVSIIALVALSAAAHAQGATRNTACDAATPTNAICLVWTHDGKDVTGVSLGKPVTFRVQQRVGTGGAFTNIATGLAATQIYVKNLAPATYYFMVFANCSPDCIESQASNTGSRDASNPVTQPTPPILTIAVVIGNGITPVYRILGSAGKYYPGEMYGFVPVGRTCTGDKKVYSYRGKAFWRVSVNDGSVPNQPTELWGTSNNANLAAACAASS